MHTAPHYSHSSLPFLRVCQIGHWDACFMCTRRSLSATAQYIGLCPPLPPSDDRSKAAISMHAWACQLNELFLNAFSALTTGRAQGVPLCESKWRYQVAPPPSAPCSMSPTHSCAGAACGRPHGALTARSSPSAASRTLAPGVRGGAAAARSRSARLPRRRAARRRSLPSAGSSAASSSWQWLSTSCRPARFHHGPAPRPAASLVSMECRVQSEL